MHPLKNYPIETKTLKKPWITTGILKSIDI